MWNGSLASECAMFIHSASVAVLEQALSPLLARRVSIGFARVSIGFAEMNRLFDKA